jgi:membrane protease YdiL (CAAX protease family)
MRLPKDYELLTLPLPFILWYFVFDVPVLDFWTRLSISTLALLLVSAPKYAQMKLTSSVPGLAAGLVSAILLYLFFWSGFQIVRGIPAFTQQTSWVYGLRGNTPLSVVSLLLLFPIGPAEEFYWRGLVQGRLGRVLSPRKALILTSVLYSLIHLSTLNPSLMLVALVGGLVWGYMFNRFKNLFPVLISHIFWDELIFVLFVIG